MRRLSTINRRVYQVPGPKSLYHIDGNHKLIRYVHVLNVLYIPMQLISVAFRWRFVIHGCIDGYSRRIVYLHCCDNYRADTVLHLFIEGVRQLGLPSRVRGDRGGENVGLARFMVEHPLTGPGRGSFVVGCSVHSQRIERLWLDVFNQCTVAFYNLFYALEEEGVLDCANEVHLFCLHYVYTSRINKH